MQTAKLYGKMFISAFHGEIVWATATVKALLVASTYTPNQGTHQYLSDVTGELSGGGYARMTVPSHTIAFDPATNTFSIGGGSFTFASMTGTYRYMILAVDTGVAGTSPLIGWLDFGVDTAAVTQPVVITVPSAGFFGVNVP